MILGELIESWAKINKAGLTVVIISSDLPEVSQRVDRVLIVKDGGLINELRKDQINESSIIKAAKVIAVTYMTILLYTIR